MNDTRVIKARLLGRKPTGGQVEALIERIVGASQALALLRASKATRPGARLQFGGGRRASSPVTGTSSLSSSTGRVLEMLEREGRMPLPPYIERAAGALTTSATRPSTRARRARSPRRPPACTSTRRCWTAAARRGRRDRLRHAARRRRHVPAGATRGPRTAPDARGALRDPAGQRRRHHPDAPGGRSPDRGRYDRLRALETAVRDDGSVPAARGRPTCSSPPATGSVSSTRCSPTSTCRSPRC